MLVRNEKKQEIGGMSSTCITCKCCEAERKREPPVLIASKNLTSAKWKLLSKGQQRWCWNGFRLVSGRGIVWIQICCLYSYEPTSQTETTKLGMNTQHNRIKVFHQSKYDFCKNITTNLLLWLHCKNHQFFYSVSVEPNSIDPNCQIWKLFGNVHQGKLFQNSMYRI